MQIDLAIVLGTASAIISGGLGVLFALARVTIANREKEIDRRLDDCRGETKSLNERLHSEEKSTIRQDGEIARSRDTHGNLNADIEEIKRTMVTKVELAGLERTMAQILGELQRNRSSGGSGRYQETPSPGSPPPKKI